MTQVCRKCSSKIQNTSTKPTLIFHFSKGSSDPPTNIVAIECGAPPVPSDGEMVHRQQSSYKIGDVVTIKCKRNKFTVTTTCLTSGDWSPVGYACTECPIGYHVYENTCYGYMDKATRYDKAKRECEIMGGHLPRPKTLEENDFIKSINRGKYTWFDARTYSDDGHKTFRWSDGSQVTWLKGDESTRFECGIINEDGDWGSTHCNFIAPKQNLICAVERLEETECHDFLEDQCKRFIEENPDMCQKHKQFGREYCAKSCGACGDSVECKVTPDDRNVKVSTPNTSITAGQFVEYTCKTGKFFKSGSSFRTCMPNGQLTGSEFHCQDCAIGYKEYKGMCYRFIDDDEEFSDAASACSKAGGFLASPRNEDENKFIHSLSNGKNVWIGATDSIVEGDFRWQDGRKVEWTNWKTGEPGNDDKDCVVLTSGMKWKEESCSRDKTYVCQTYITDPETCYNIDDKGATYAGHVDVAKTMKKCIPWATATKCPQNPFKPGYERKNLVENYCRNPDNSHQPWCYVDADSCDKQYCDVCQHEEGTDYTSVRCSVPKPPSDGLIKDKVKAEYKIGDVVHFACNETGGWISTITTTCLSNGQWSPVGLTCIECPTGYHKHNNKCYGFIGDPMEYVEARKYCEKNVQGYIAWPNNEEENEFIFSMRRGYDIWLGLNDIESEGTFVHEDGTAVSWDNWESGEPNNWGYGEDATVMRWNKQWNDLYTWKDRRFICFTPARDRKNMTCVDFLKGQCPRLVAQNEDICTENTDFAFEYCAKTCKLCKPEQKTTTVGPSVLKNGDKDTPPNAAFFGLGEQYKIKVSGEIVAWEFYSSSPLETAFQVWRSVNEDDVYKLIGQNIITTSEESSLQRYEVPAVERIPVLEGDLIGIYNNGKGGVKFDVCDKTLHPEWSARFHWSGRKNMDAFTIGAERTFHSGVSCVLFPLRAVINYTD